MKDDGRILIAARKCNVSPVTVFGALVTLWCYADAHADENGYLVGWTSEDVNARVGVDGFAESLPSDWIDLSGEWVKLPEYTEHNGSTAKARAATNRRVAKHRERNAATVTKSLPEKRREEKNREDNKKEKNKKKKDSPAPVCDLWSGCEFFRMTLDEFQRVSLWYQKNNLPDALVDLAIAEVDRWLAGESTQAKAQRKKTTSHYRQLMASWVIENAQKIAKAGGRGGNLSNVEIAIQEMKKYGGGK